MSTRTPRSSLRPQECVVRVWHPELCAAKRTIPLLQRWCDEMDAGMKKGDLSLTIDALKRLVAARETEC